MASARNAGSESGLALAVALILALALAVVSAAVISSLGAGSDVSRNRLWAETAAARAEAGLEYAKTVLAAWVERDGSLNGMLPPARARIRAPEGARWGVARPEDPGACRDPQQAGCRDYQMFRDEPVGGASSRIYVGRVLRTPEGRALFFDPRDPRAGWTPSDATVDLNGVTVWARRPVVGTRDAGDPHDRVVLTAEARYPPPADADDPHAVSRIEMAIRVAPRPPSEEGGLDDYGGPGTQFRLVDRRRGGDAQVVE